MQIPLRGGGHTIIDDSDLPIASAHPWRNGKDRRARNRTSYAVFSKPGELVFLHRLIMGAQKGDFVDHIDGNGLNNQRSNLRICTQSQNRANGRQWKIPKSGFRGVYPKGSRWFAAISSGPHSIKQLGTFDTKEEAARAYDKAALARWGAFARLNFPISDPDQKIS